MQRPRRKLPTRVSVSRKKLNKLLPESYATYTELVEEMEKMVEYRAETIERMNSVANELGRRHHETNIAKLVGTSVSILGTAGAAVGSVGLALVPFTAGLSATVAAVGGGISAVAGGIALTLGTLTTAGAQFVEKLLEHVDLADVQRVVDKDRAQCERVQQLWNKFESYSSDIVKTVGLVDLSKDPDLESLKKWILVAVRKTKSKVPVVAEAFHAAYKEITASKGKSCGSSSTEKVEIVDKPTAGSLMGSLLATAMGIAGDEIMKSAVSHLTSKNCFVVVGVACFLLVAAIGVGNLFVLITTSINVHKGSLSSVAKDIREKSSQLEQEFHKWVEAFADKEGQ